MKRSSVRLFVCLSHRLTATAASGKFAAERRVGRKYRLTAAGAAQSNGAVARRSAANAGSVMLTRLNKYAAMPYTHCRALKDVAKQRLFRSIGCFGWTLTSLCLARRGRATCSIRRETEGAMSVAEAPCTQSRLEVAGKLSYSLQATRHGTIDVERRHQLALLVVVESYLYIATGALDSIPRR